MDVRRSAAATAMNIPSPDQDRHRSLPSSRTNSHTSTASTRSGEPMAIPGTRFDDAPPPLPPPRFNEELERGVDVAWSWGNTNSHGGKSMLAPIKPGSSLYGGYLQSNVDTAHATDEDGMGMDMDMDEDPARRGSTVSTIRSPSQADTTAVGHIPSLVRRPPSPVLGNQRLHGEQPLAQENFNRSSQAYDQRVLSKIGKPNSPPRHLRSDSTDSTLLAQKLSLQTKETKPQHLSVNDLPSSATDPVSRWMTSPASAAVSPGGRPGWRDYNMGQRSPSLDSTATSLVLDPELFVQPRNSGRLSTSVNDDSVSLASRSNRGSYDQAIFTDPEGDLSMEENGGLRNLNLDDPHSRVEGKASKQGMKRRALSPPSDMGRDDKSLPHSAELYHKYASANAARSPATRYQPKHGSVSSTSSSIRHNSYASSIALSVAGSSMTSVSSFDRNSPSDHTLPYLTSAQPVSSPATSIAPSRKPQSQHSQEYKPAARQLSVQTTMSEPHLPPAHRVGSYYICDCCPKKPKKFDTEDDLRAHQMEKQYSCQYCNNRFKNKNEAERHQNSLHLRRHSWSCAAIPSYQAAFHPSTSAASQGPTGPVNDACGFCGDEFPNHPQPDWDRRIDHLTDIHKFGECNQSKKFYRADHFRQHLKHSHAGQSGKWTNLLENVCLREEPPADASGVSPTSSETSQTRGPSSLPAPADTPMGGATIDEAQEES